MFYEHQMVIGKFARESHKNMASVATLSYLSAHQPFFSMPQQMKEVQREGASASCLFSWKRDAYHYWADNNEEVYEKLMRLWLNGDVEFPDEALLVVTEAPGFGFVKGGFFLQMCFGVSGCIDTHNLREYKLEERLVKVRKPVAYHSCVKYNSMVERLGGTAPLWDAWCSTVHSVYPTLYSSPYDVSKLHCEALGL